jgi:hypothetical protein
VGIVIIIKVALGWPWRIVVIAALFIGRALGHVLVIVILVLAKLSLNWRIGLVIVRVVLLLGFFWFVLIILEFFVPLHDGLCFGLNQLTSPLLLQLVIVLHQEVLREEVLIIQRN